MEARLSISSASVSPITALTYQLMRREIVTGHEDGALKCWEVDSGRLAVTLQQHRGWVTDLLYWHEGRVLFSASVDGTVVQWSSAGIAYNIIEVDGPVFSLLWGTRKEQLLCGRDNGITILNTSGKFASNGLALLSKKGIHIPGHRDIVRCLSCMGNKVFSAGYDRKLIIYEVSSMPGEQDSPLKCIHMNPAAHDAGITCLLVAKDTDSSTWIATGSFDKKVKIWTADGKLIHSIQCNDTVSGVCYVPQMRVLWISAGTSTPNFYEPKSGENISDCMPVLGNIKHITGNSVVQLLKYFPEINEVVGTTNRKAVLSWRYNPSCCVCVQDAPSVSHIETLTYTSKVPILLFTGSYDGEVTKWERLQLNPFMYSQEPLFYREQLGIHLESEEGEKNMLEILQGHPHEEGGGPQTGGGRKHKEGMSEEVKERTRMRLIKPKFRGFLKSLFVESLDFLVASSLDGKIFVWGYDKKTVAVLMKMQRQSHNNNATHDHQKLSDGCASEASPDEDSAEHPQMQSKLTEGSVISRVAGFTCLYILNGHSASVTGLAVVERDKSAGVHTTCLLSAGWDLTICVWDLENGRLMAQLNVSSPPSSAVSFNSDSDDIITDLSYSKERNVFAYSSSDKLVYLRRFSENQAEMEVVGTLTGHCKEVTQVSWNSFCSRWISGSEDGTVRTWAADGGACEQVVSTGGPISVLCIDKTNGAVIAAVQQVIKVYDSDLELLRVSHGHTDSIRTIIHVPELDQYISAGWDNTLRVWNTCHPKGVKKAPN